MIQHALEDSLTRMRLEGASPEECLAQYPEFRDELAPMLQAALGLGTLEALEPRPEFRRQARTRLLGHMRANPRRQPTVNTSQAFRYAAGLAMLFVVLASTGTALAQKSLPGDSLYGLKLASEQIWYNLNDNPIDADLFLTTRRISEIEAIKGRSNLEEIGVNAYSVLLHQLALDLAQDPDKATKVGELLQIQKEQLKAIYEKSEANLPPMDELFSVVNLPVQYDPGPPEGRGPSQDSQLPVVPPVVSPKKEKEDNENKPDKEDKGKSDNSRRNNKHN